MSLERKWKGFCELALYEATGVHIYKLLVFYLGSPEKLKEFCRYHMDLSYSGTWTFPAPVEFGAWKQDRNRVG